METSKPTFTIVRNEYHYDTYDERFYTDSWERTMDVKEYLELIIKNDPARFDGCKIENNSL